jgi:uncharacterized repeat protein (TIGR01451 family)
MNGWRRPARFVFLLQTACVALTLTLVPGPVYAESGPVPSRPTQGVPLNTPEPPLADGPAVPPEPTLLPPRILPTEGAVAPAAPVFDPPVPVVAIRVRVPAHALPDRELTYRITVENTSQARACHVRVNNPLPRGVRFVKATPEPAAQEPALRWDLGNLEPAARKEIVLVVVPTDGAEIRNCARVQFEHGQCVVTRIDRPELRLRATGPDRVRLNRAAKFVLEVTNTGRAEARNVVLTDKLPAGLDFHNSTPQAAGENPLTWKLGTLAPGQTRRVEYNALAFQAGRFENRAVVEGAGGLRREATHGVFVGEPRLNLVKSGPARRLVNRPTPYLITVTNVGDIPAENVRVTDELHRNLVFLRASDGGRVMGDRVEWALGTVAPGARRTVRLEVRAVKADGAFHNVATAAADDLPSVQSRADTDFEVGAGLTAEIDPSGDPVEAGRPATYTVRLLNAGKERATNVGLVVAVPNEVRLTGARGRTTVAEQDRQKVRFMPVPGLPPGAEAVYTISVRAEQPGSGPLTVEVTSDQTAATPLRWEEKITVAGPSSPQKAPAAEGNRAAPPGTATRPDRAPDPPR